MGLLGKKKKLGFFAWCDKNGWVCVNGIQWASQGDIDRLSTITVSGSTVKVSGTDISPSPTLRKFTSQQIFDMHQKYLKS